MLEIEPGSPGRAASVLKYWATSPVLSQFFNDTAYMKLGSAHLESMRQHYSTFSATFPQGILNVTDEVHMGHVLDRLQATAYTASYFLPE